MSQKEITRKRRLPPEASVRRFHHTLPTTPSGGEWPGHCFPGLSEGGKEGTGVQCEGIGLSLPVAQQLNPSWLSGKQSGIHVALYEQHVIYSLGHVILLLSYLSLRGQHGLPKF